MSHTMLEGPAEKHGCSANIMGRCDGKNSAVVEQCRRTVFPAKWCVSLVRTNNR